MKNIFIAYTWVRQGGGEVVDRGMMDHVILPTNVARSLFYVRVFRGENGGMSDLVEGKLRP